MPGPSSSLPPDVMTAIEAALADAEKTVPEVKANTTAVRADVEAAVGAALASLERVVPKATEAEVTGAFAGDPTASIGSLTALADLSTSASSSTAETTRVMQALGNAAFKEAR